MEIPVPLKAKKRKLDQDQPGASPKRRLNEDDALAVDLVLQETFKNLSVKDLLNCSLVNQQWCSNARSVLRNDKVCVAYIRKCMPCKDLKTLNDLLKSSSNIPMNGLSINTWVSIDGHTCIDCNTNNVDEFYSALLQDFQLKHLELNWAELSDCPAQSFIKKMVCSQATTALKSLEIFRFPEAIPSVREFFSIPNSIKHWLPRLQSLELNFEMDTEVKAELFAAAPNLKLLSGTTTPEDLLPLLEQNKSGVIREFELCPTPRTIEACQKFASSSSSRLKRLTVCSNLKSEMENGIQILKSLAGNNSKTLETLDISQLNLLLLHLASMPPLTLVTQLQLGYSPRIDQIEGYSTLRILDFPKSFPNLTTVEIHGEHFQGDFDSIRKSLRSESLKGGCSSVRTFRITPGFFRFDEATLTCIASVFTNVKDFCVMHCMNVEGYLNVLWTVWPGLESILFSNTSKTFLDKNLDYIFCGLDAEEIQGLGKFEEGELKKLQIPRSKPSILNLDHLRKLQFQIIYERQTREREDFFSDVTTALAFSRMANFTMEIMPVQFK